MKKADKETISPNKALEYYNTVAVLKQIYSSDPHSSDVRDILAQIEGKDPLTYAKMPPRAISKKIKAHEKKAEDLLKENVTYEWLIKNKPLQQIESLLFLLPDLKDKDKYSKVYKAAEELKKAQTIQDKESYVREFYKKKIDEAKSEGDKAVEYADLYAAVSSQECLDDAYKGIILSLRYELQKSLKEAGAKEKGSEYKKRR